MYFADELVDQQLVFSSQYNEEDNSQNKNMGDDNTNDN